MTKQTYGVMTPEAMAYVYGQNKPLQGASTIKADPDTKLIIGSHPLEPTEFYTYPVVEWEVCLGSGVIEILPRTKEYGFDTDYAVKTGIAAIQMPGRDSVIIKGSAIPAQFMEDELKRNAKVEHDAFLSTRKVADLGIKKAAN